MSADAATRAFPRLTLTINNLQYYVMPVRSSYIHSNIHLILSYAMSTSYSRHDRHRPIITVLMSPLRRYTFLPWFISRKQDEVQIALLLYVAQNLLKYWSPTRFWLLSNSATCCRKSATSFRLFCWKPGPETCQQALSKIESKEI